MRCTPPLLAPQQRHSPTKDVKSNATTESSLSEVPARIRVVVQRGNANLVLGGWAPAISESGMCAFVAEELRLGEVVALEVPLPQSATLTVLRELRGA